MDLATLQGDYKIQILEIAKQSQAENIRLFGAIIPADQREGNDIDFLVHMQAGSGFAIGGLKWHLEDLLKCQVDVVPDTSLNRMIKDKILKEAAPL